MNDEAKVVSTSNEGIDFDPDALRAKYREERDKRLRADGNEQYVEVKGDFSRYVDDPYVDPGFTREPLNDAVEVADHRRRLRRPARGRASARGGRARYPHHREGRGLRRHLVLEPLSGRAVRYRGIHLSAAARGDRLHPEGEVLLRSGNPGPRAAYRRKVRSISQRLLSDSDQRYHLERRRVPVDRYHGSRRPDERALRRHVQRTAEPAEAAGDSGHRQLTRGIPSTPAAGITDTPAAIPPEICTNSATSGSPLSAPARRPSNAYRTSQGTRSNCTCSSARLRQSMSAATGRPIRNG